VKMIKGLAFICLLGFYHQAIFSDVEPEDKGYQNQVVAVEEFDTPSSTKIIVSFEQSNPVCMYSPKTFQESLDDTTYRAVMPRTGVAPGVVCGHGDTDYDNEQDGEHLFDCDSDEDSVEFVLHGKSIKKFIGDNHVIFIVKK